MPALDIVYPPEPVFVNVINRSVKQVPLHHVAVSLGEGGGYQVVAAREPDDQRRFVERLIGGFAASVAFGGTDRTDRVVGVAFRIADQDRRGAPQTLCVSRQTPAQGEQYRHAAEQQVGAESPRGVEAAAGQQFAVDRAAMHVRLAGIEVQLGGVPRAEVVVVVPGGFVRRA